MQKIDSLAQEACEACRKDAPRLGAEEIGQLLTALPSWQWRTEAGIDRLEREYSFADFVSALAFTNRVGEMAEQLNHHPDILTAWGRVKLVWYSHKISGLHRNDFRCAARSDQLYSE